MKKDITMPSFGDDKEATLVAWNFEPGDEFKKGDIIFEVEAAKAVSEVEATEDGIMGEQFFEEGDEVNLGEKIAEIETK